MPAAAVAAANAQYARQSLGIFPLHTDLTRPPDQRPTLWKLRRALIRLVHSSQFDLAVVGAICLNTLLLGLVDYSCVGPEGDPTASSAHITTAVGTSSHFATSQSTSATRILRFSRLQPVRFQGITCRN